jgi:hypothetical protein
VIETGHGGEVGGVDVGGVGSGNQAVGVCGVANNASLDVLVRVLVHGLADGGEDGTVVLRRSMLQEMESERGGGGGGIGE